VDLSTGEGPQSPIEEFAHACMFVGTVFILVRLVVSEGSLGILLPCEEGGRTISKTTLGWLLTASSRSRSSWNGVVLSLVPPGQTEETSVEGNWYSRM